MIMLQSGDIYFSRSRFNRYYHWFLTISVEVDWMHTLELISVWSSYGIIVSQVQNVFIARKQNSLI